MTRWEFAPRQRMSTQRDPVYEEFFTGGEAMNPPAALVREAVQNSLDAVLDAAQPVRVVITTSPSGESLAATEAASYFDNLMPHVGACGLAGITPGHFAQECAFVIYEDFNTTGLTGDANQFEKPQGNNNNFFYFFRNEGSSGKSAAERGRWGIGKYVFPMCSDIRTFFALSRRVGDSENPESSILMGKAILRNHTLGSSGFQPDGWWASIEDDAPFPITEPESLGKFMSDWGLARELGQPGTSIVIPFIREEVDHASLATAVAAEYHLAVLSGRLTVEVRSGSASTTFDQATIADIAPATIEDEGLSDQVSRDLALLTWHLTNPPKATCIAFPGGKAPAWSDAEFEQDGLDAIRRELDDSGHVSVVVPIRVATSDGLTAESSVTVLLEARPDWSGPAAYYREGILLSKEQESVKLRGIRAIVIADDAPVAGMLGDAENPAHTKWSQTSAKFSGKYTNGASWLRIVRSAPQQLLRKLHGDVTEPDLNLAKEFFSLPVSAAPDKPGKGVGDEGGEGVVEPPNPPEGRTPAAVRISGSSGRVVLSLVDVEGRADITVVHGEIAYDVRRGNAFLRYRPADFDLAKLKVTSQGTSSHSRSGNTFRVEVANPSDFRFTIDGFDLNRDLIVSADVVRSS